MFVCWNLERDAGVEPSLTGLEDQHSHRTANPAKWYRKMELNHLRAHLQCTALPMSYFGKIKRLD